MGRSQFLRQEPYGISLSFGAILLIQSLAGRNQERKIIPEQTMIVSFPLGEAVPGTLVVETFAFGHGIY